MLKGSEENERPYSKSDVPELLHKLLKKGLIQLPKSKHPENVRRTNDLKYCKYHRIIGHPIDKCNTFRGQVVQLAKDEKIIFNGEDTKESD